MAPTQRTQWVTYAGDLSNMVMETSELPDPGLTEVQISVQNCGFNFADLFACLGLYSATPKGKFTPGLEFAGVITKIGGPPGVEMQRARGFAVGDKVMGATRFGGYSTDLNIDTRYIRKLPSGWSMREGAAFLTQCLTAWYGLIELGNIGHNERGATVLVHSAAGGVGLFACDIVQGFGGKVIATIGSESKVEFLMKRAGLKREQIIVRTGGGVGFTKQLKTALASIGREGIDVAFDSLGGDYFMPAYELLNPMGRHIQYGAASMTPHGSSPGWLTLAWQWLRRPKLDPLEMISENKAVIGFNLIWLWDQVHELTPVLDEMLQFAFRPPHIGVARPFAEAHDALVEFQQGMTVGKVVLDVGKRDEVAAEVEAANAKASRRQAGRAGAAVTKYVVLAMLMAAPFVLQVALNPDASLMPNMAKAMTLGL